MDASIELVKHLLLPVVHIHAVVAREHPSTQILGGDRSGSGLVVDASGLILTVNYIVMGAQSIEVAFAKGRRNLNEIARSSLAIPTDYYRKHEPELLRYGRVVSRPRRAWLGVFAHPVEEGVVVAGVVPDGPGDRGGLQEGDLIVSLNSEEVASRRDLYTRLWRHEPGERLILEVMRENKVRRVEVLGGDRAYFFRQL